MVFPSPSLVFIAYSSTLLRLWNCWSLKSVDQALNYLVWHLTQSGKHKMSVDDAEMMAAAAEVSCYMDTRKDRDEQRRWSEEGAQKKKAKLDQSQSQAPTLDLTRATSTGAGGGLAILPSSSRPRGSASTTLARQNSVARAAVLHVL